MPADTKDRSLYSKGILRKQIKRRAVGFLRERLIGVLHISYSHMESICALLAVGLGMADAGVPFPLRMATPAAADGAGGRERFGKTAGCVLDGRHRARRSPPRRVSGQPACAGVRPVSSGAFSVTR